MLLELQNVHKTYAAGDEPVHALRGVDLAVERGEFVALVGPSGCGKSTLLHLAGAMDRPTSGRVVFDGTALETMSDTQLTRLRRERIGFVFQFFNLLPTLTAVENVALPLMLAGAGPGAADARARELIRVVGLEHRAHRYPQQLSGGEMQRCAIARAIVHAPALLVADEPTGNLDSQNGQHILELMRRLNEESKLALLLATHAPDIAAAAHRTVHVRDGVIERETASAVHRTAAIR